MVERVGAVLFIHHALCAMTHSYYCSAARQSSGKLGYITHEGWAALMHDCKIVGHEHCSPTDLESIFARMGRIRKEGDDVLCHGNNLAAEATVTHKRTTAHHERRAVGLATNDGNGGVALSRVEFMVALVHVAIHRYVLAGEVSNVADAVDSLFRAHLRLSLGTAFPPPDDFRRASAYTYEVHEVLCHHEPSLRVLFNFLDRVSCTPRALISLDVWTRFLRKVGLEEGGASERASTLCFLWSIMCVADSRLSKFKERSLPFEGFLEALCRLSALKGLPTDDEVRAAGFADAGMYMTVSLDPGHDPEASQRLLERTTRFGVVQRVQPVSRCVDHLIFIIVRRIAQGEAGATSPSLIGQEASLSDQNQRPQISEKVMAKWAEDVRFGD